MIFLGTGAAELIPDPFCECDVCRFARQSEDAREKRRRSSFLLDAHTLIDPGPDVPFACAQYGVSLSGLQNIFITHMHSDHFSPGTLDTLRMCLTQKPCLRVFMSPEAMAGLTRAELSAAMKLCELHAVAPGETAEAGSLRATALRTIHSGAYEGETAVNYLFERGGRRLLYACDTGLYPEENDALLAGKPIDTLIIECTFGDGDYPLTCKHMTLQTLRMTLERMEKLGARTDKTQVWLTHIAHKGLLTHEALGRRAAQELGEHVSVAWDGLRLPDTL